VQLLSPSGCAEALQTDLQTLGVLRPMPALDGAGNVAMRSITL